MATGAKVPKTNRFVTAAFGLLFTVVSIAVVFMTDRTIGPMLVALVIGILGVEAIISAWRNKPSLLSRIGPLP
jgi:hypothetical protein